MPKSRLLLPLALTAVTLLPCLGHAQTREQIREQDERLYEQQQQDQSSQPAGLSPPSADSGSVPAAGAGGLTAQLLDRVSRLEGQVRTLEGRVDELQQELSTRTADLDKKIGDLSFAVQQSGGAAAAAGAGAGAGAAAAIAPTDSATVPRRAPPPQVA